MYTLFSFILDMGYNPTIHQCKRYFALVILSTTNQKLMRMVITAYIHFLCQVSSALVLLLIHYGQLNYRPVCKAEYLN